MIVNDSIGSNVCVSSIKDVDGKAEEEETNITQVACNALPKLQTPRGELEKIRQVEVQSVEVRSVGDAFIDRIIKRIEEGKKDYSTLSSKLRGNKKIALAAMKVNGKNLIYASEALKNDPEVVEIAGIQNVKALEDAPWTLRSDPTFVFAMVTKNGLALKYVSLEFREDPVYVEAAVTQNGLALEHASKPLRKAPGIIAAAENQNPLSSEYALKEDTKSDRWWPYY